MAVTDTTHDEKQAMKRAEILDRFTYRAPSEYQKTLLAAYHALLMLQVEFVVDNILDSRDRAVALTSLEETRMKVNKAIVFGAPLPPGAVIRLEQPAPEMVPADGRPEYTG